MKLIRMAMKRKAKSEFLFNPLNKSYIFEETLETFLQFLHTINFKLPLQHNFYHYTCINQTIIVVIIC